MFNQSKLVKQPPAGFYLSAEDWAAQTNLKRKEAHYKIIDYEDGPETFTSPNGIEDSVHWRFIEEQQRKPPPTFLATIPGGRVWGTNGAVIAPDNKLLWDLSFQYGIATEEHPIFSMKSLPALQERKDTVAVLTFCASQYYYHWMFDVLPRLELLRREETAFKKIVLNYNGSPPFQKDTLSSLGIPQGQIIPCHRHFHLKAKKLVVPSPVGYTGHMPKWTTTFLRKNFLPKESEKGRLKRLYISRAYAKNRKILNEDRVINILSGYGFETVLPELMTVAEQARLFSSAEAIVSAHGGGLTNLVFCQAGTKVLEFFSPNYVNVLYWVLSNHVNLDYYYLIGEGERPAEYVDPHLVWDNITVNLDQLTGILKKMGM